MRVGVARHLGFWKSVRDVVVVWQPPPHPLLFPQPSSRKTTWIAPARGAVAGSTRSRVRPAGAGAARGDGQVRRRCGAALRAPRKAAPPQGAGACSAACLTARRTNTRALQGGAPRAAQSRPSSRQGATPVAATLWAGYASCGYVLCGLRQLRLHPERAASNAATPCAGFANCG